MPKALCAESFLLGPCAGVLLFDALGGGCKGSCLRSRSINFTFFITFFHINLSNPVMEQARGSGLRGCRHRFDESALINY